jgi:hypothetical protein
MTYRNFLLRQDNSTVLSTDANGHDVGGGDGFEGIFYDNHNMSAPVTAPGVRSLGQIVVLLRFHLSVAEEGGKRRERAESPYRLDIAVPVQKKW